MSDILKPVRDVVAARKAIQDESRTAMQASFRAFLARPQCLNPAIAASLAYEDAWNHGALWATERADKIRAEAFAMRQPGEPS